MRLLLILVLIANLAMAQISPFLVQVRQALLAGDLSTAARLLDSAHQSSGATLDWFTAAHWMARVCLAAKDYDSAARYAGEIRQDAVQTLRHRQLDAEPALPQALGAAIEVESQVLNAKGRKAESVAFLQDQLKLWRGTSIESRIHKNLNLITLQGKPAPALDVRQYLGAPPPTLASLRGRRVLLFFWAHWCGDCKADAAVIARIAAEHPRLAIIGPTQTYGYVAGGEDAAPSAELPYIDQVRRKYYSVIPGMTVPVGAENFLLWGASTTPTIAVLDAAGTVRLYHPGKMTYQELAPYVSD